jgi:hypothetical protein
MNAFGLSVTVFITQKWNEQVASHINAVLIIRKGKFLVSKIVKKSISETKITTASTIVACKKKRFRLIIVF